MLQRKKSKRMLVVSVLLLAVLLQPVGIIPITAGGQNTPDTEVSIPALPIFIELVSDGSSKEITGVYVEGQFALPVTQQPASQPGYVSNRPDTITQFGTAENYGTIGLLAHNYLAGEYFFKLTSGTEVVIVYGDKSLERYTVSSSSSFQALQPDSPYSSFENLATGNHLSAADLFEEMYQQPGTITFQTCIAHDDISSWGRFFVHAVPADNAVAAGTPAFPVFIQ